MIQFFERIKERIDAIKKLSDMKKRLIFNNNTKKNKLSSVLLQD
jgi:hypothetical protein